MYLLFFCLKKQIPRRAYVILCPYVYKINPRRAYVPYVLMSKE